VGLSHSAVQEALPKMKETEKTMRTTTGKTNQQHRGIARTSGTSTPSPRSGDIQTGTKFPPGLGAKAAAGKTDGRQAGGSEIRGVHRGEAATAGGAQAGAAAVIAGAAAADAEIAAVRLEKIAAARLEEIAAIGAEAVAGAGMAAGTQTMRPSKLIHDKRPRTPVHNKKQKLLPTCGLVIPRSGTCRLAHRRRSGHRPRPVAWECRLGRRCMRVGVIDRDGRSSALVVAADCCCYLLLPVA